MAQATLTDDQSSCGGASMVGSLKSRPVKVKNHTKAATMAMVPKTYPQILLRKNEMP